MCACVCAGVDLNDLHEDEELVIGLVGADLIEDERVVALGEDVLLVHDVLLLMG